MTRKSAKTTAINPPIRRAEGKTESQSGQASWPLPHFLQQLFGMRRGGTWKGIGFTQKQNDGKKRGERRGWITQEGNCLFSTGQTGLSSTFTHRDESVLLERELMPVYLSGSQKAEETYGRQQGHVICWSKRWLPRGSEAPTYQDLFSLQDVLLRQLGGRASSVHRVPAQISIHWKQTSTQIITTIIRDLKVSTGSCSTRLVVSLLGHRGRKVRLTTGNLHLM